MMEHAIELNIGINLLHLTLHGVISLLAGIAKGLNKLQSKGFSFGDLCTSALISSITGIILYFFLDWLECPMNLSLFIIGIAGWLGGNWMDFLGLFSKKFLGKMYGINITQEEENKHSELINK